MTSLILNIMLIAGLPLDAKAAPVDFVRDVRPIFQKHCISCHGPDKAGRKADLRLDHREDAVKAGAIDLKNLSESEILARIEQRTSLSNGLRVHVMILQLITMQPCRFYFSL